MRTLRLTVTIPDPKEFDAFDCGELLMDAVIDAMNSGDIPFQYGTWAAEWVDNSENSP